MTSSVTMLVLGLAFSLMILTVRAQSTQAASGTTVSNSQQCTYTWVTSSNTNYAGGTGNSATSLADCQANCISSSTCVAIDFNTVAATGSQCWLLTSLSGQRYNSNGINHYDLTRNCQTSCTPTWTATVNTNYQGGVVNSATTEAECKAACLASSGCIALDFNSVATAGQQCWLLYNLNGAKLSNNGITHYELVQSCPVPYYAYLNQEYGGLRIDSSSNTVVTSFDFNQLTLFTESACLAQSISTFNNTPNCISLSPMGNSSNYVYLSNTSNYQLLLQSPDATDRFKEDASFVKIPNAPTAGYYYLQPSAAYSSNMKFYITGSSSSALILAPQVWDSTAASFYKSTIYVSTLPVTGTCPYVWTRISNARMTKSISLPATNGLTDCLSRCLVYPNCVGVSWGSGECYAETSAATVLTLSTSYWYFELATSSPLPCPRGCLYTFSYQMNAAYSYFSQASSVSSFYCRNLCVTTPTCIGYNWISSTSSIGTCYLYQSGTNIGNFTAVSRTLTKCGCAPTTYYNLNASDVNAVQASGVSGFSSCYTACINNRACTGFDLRNNDCYLSTTALANTNVVFNTSYVHVDLVRRRSCGNGCQDKWDFFASTSMTGTTQYNAAVTESACRQACRANSTCTAISWNTVSSTCFLATSSSLRSLEGTSLGWNTYNLYRLPFCDAIWGTNSADVGATNSPYS